MKPQYVVDTHSHTIASTHAYSTLQEYVVEAKRKGIVLFATTDHGPEMADAPHPWHFVNLRVIPRVIDGVGILRGIEANIKNEFGDIDCDARMNNELDIILAGFHDPVFGPKDRDTNTRTMINVMKKGIVHIITHPGNPRYPIDIDAVAEAAAKYQVALEINNSSFVHSRTGSDMNCRHLAQAVKSSGGWVSLGSDAHIAYSLGELTKSIEVLESIDFPSERILNKTPRTLLDFLVMRGKAPIAEFAEL